VVTTFYLDTSVAVKILFGDSPSAQQWFDDAVASESDSVISSRLLQTELTRVLRREGRDVHERDLIQDYVGIMRLDHAVLIAAESIGPHIKTLDAIHLASAVRSGIDDLVVVSHDHNVQHVAEQLALAVFDPCAG
jgi:predicted nucleic acid-binding protein